MSASAIAGVPTSSDAAAGVPTSIDGAANGVTPGAGFQIEDPDGDRRAAADLVGTMVRASREEWRTRAICLGGDPDALFVSGAAQRDAANLCLGCPVRLECLVEALDGRVEFGVWGGMTERARRALLKRCPDVVSWRDVLEDARTEAGRRRAG